MRAKVISETPMHLAEVKEELKRIQERDKELGFRGQKTVEYLESYPLTLKQAQELAGKLQKLEVPRLREAHLFKLVDVLPTTVRDVKGLLQASNVTVTNENLKKLADAITEHLGAAK
jgi:DNA-directed RNA polymerase subunit F